jgi:hypothetical protein
MSSNVLYERKLRENNMEQQSHLPSHVKVQQQLYFPLPGKHLCGITADSMHFKEIDIRREVMIPIAPHVGGFGVTRKFHVHEGVDLYCNHGDPVHTMEAGVVIAIIPFTGEIAGSPWWKNTYAVFVQGKSGIINYGELQPMPHLRIGSELKGNEHVGNILEVLLKDKGRPRSMLHLELYDGIPDEWACWKPGAPRPPKLCDPTPLLVRSSRVPLYLPEWPIELPKVVE